jgi:hypothetical protein
MHGIELARRYFLEAGLPALRERFPSLVERVAAGLVAGGLDSGAGSEIGGFDDDISRDHNWGPRFFVFLAEDDCARQGEAVHDALADALPEEFMGFRRHATTLPDSPVHVTSPRRNLQAVLGIRTPPTSDSEWMSLPESLLFEYTGGEVFYEPVPLVSPLRQAMAYYPDDFLLHAAGNARRMALRGDVLATRSYVTWFLTCVMRTCSLLRRRYAPYGKWLPAAFRRLPDLPPGLIAKTEALAARLDLRTVESRMYEILDMVGTMANDSGLIERVPLRKKSPYVWTDFRCYGFMEAFHRKLKGPLAQTSPYEGPLDMWVDNHLPLKPDVLRAAWNPHT